MNTGNNRRFYDSSKAAGKAFLPLQSSAAQHVRLLNCGILRRPRLQYLWDSQAWRNSPSGLPCLLPPRISPWMGAQGLPPLHHHRPASLPCPTSRSPTVPTMRQSLNPKPSPVTIRSTSRMEVLRFYVAGPSFVFTQARCHYALPCSVGCFRRQI